MREMEFRMERPDLVKAGDRVELKEDSAVTMAGVIYYYTIRNAVAMSNNVKEKLTRLTGTVKEVVTEGSIYTVTVEIDE